MMINYIFTHSFFPFFNNIEFHMSALNKMKQVLEHLQNYYPETLHRLFVVNAPSAFLIMWKVIKPWLDQRVKSIILFLYMY